MTGKHKENYNKNYLDYVKTQDPPTKHLKNCAAAFGVGGFICCIGQFFRYMLEFAGLSGDVLAGSVSVILIFIGCLLTGLGVYDRIGRHAGAGSIVPITGFANSVASPAIEFKTEGWIYGMAAKMFTVAGAIIVFGVFSGVLVGIIYMFV
jgi:stage V sporulation protein AC